MNKAIFRKSDIFSNVKPRELFDVIIELGYEDAAGGVIIYENDTTTDYLGGVRDISIDELPENAVNTLIEFFKA